MPNQMPLVENRPSKILIVDDEPFNLDVIEQELEDFGLDIFTATNGHEALELVTNNPPDMIFLDLMMPVMDGFEVLEQLGSSQEWRSIPVVIISASTDMNNIVRGIEMGAVDFLPKPLEPAILHARLNAGLEKKRLHDLEHKYLRSLERELEIGREIQAGFLPKVIPQPDGWQIMAYFQAAREVAGDFYDVFDLEQGKLGLLLGDVTDKGVGSALYMALYRSLLRATVMAPSLMGESHPIDNMPSENRILQAVTLVNRYICKLHDSAMYATIFFGILDTTNGQLCYLNAGHEPPYLLRNKTILKQIEPTGPIVGALEQASYRIETLTLLPRDSLLMYSDGIQDSRNAAGEMFGRDRLDNLLQHPTADPSVIFNSVLKAIEDHLNGTAQYDDITLLLVNRKEA
jgi:sigma-B regulation protein RsbU (phosphoserine phosphatase)